MSMGSTRARLRAIAATGVLALAAGSATVLGTAGAASAQTLSFDCNVPILGTQTFSANITSNAPAQLPTGSSATPTVTTVLTVPASLADLMRSLLSADHVDGVIHSTALVNGVAQVVDLTVPLTAVGASGTDVPLSATGTLAPITAGAPGTVTTVAAGAQDAALNLISAGSPSAFDVPCTPSAGQTLTLAKITSVKDTSRTRAKAAYSKAKHQAAVTVTVASTHGVVKPTGKVKLVLKRGSKKVASVTRTLKSGKVANAFKNLRKAGSYKVTASYAGSSRLKASSGTVKFRVR